MSRFSQYIGNANVITRFRVRQLRVAVLVFFRYFFSLYKRIRCIIQELKCVVLHHIISYHTNDTITIRYHITSHCISERLVYWFAGLYVIEKRRISMECGHKVLLCLNYVCLYSAMHKSSER